MSITSPLYPEAAAIEQRIREDIRVRYIGQVMSERTLYAMLNDMNFAIRDEIAMGNLPDDAKITNVVLFGPAGNAEGSPYMKWKPSKGIKTGIVGDYEWLFGCLTDE